MDFLHALIKIQGRTLVPIQSPLFTVQSLSDLMVCFVTCHHVVGWVRLLSKFFQSLSTASPLERNNTRRGYQRRVLWIWDENQAFLDQIAREPI